MITRLRNCISWPSLLEIWRPTKQPQLTWRLLLLISMTIHRYSWAGKIRRYNVLKLTQQRKWEIWRKFAKCLAKIERSSKRPFKKWWFWPNGDLVKFRQRFKKNSNYVQRGPLKSGDLTKNRQRQNKNSNWMFKGTSWKSDDFDENGDLAQFPQMFNENSNYISQRAAWKVAILKKWRMWRKWAFDKKSPKV